MNPSSRKKCFIILNAIFFYIRLVDRLGPLYAFDKRFQQAKQLNAVRAEFKINFW